jgi:hypothetical protein
MFEFFVLFVALPTFFYWMRLRVPALPALWLLTFYCLAVMWREGRLSAAGLSTALLVDRLPSILAIFLPFAVAATWFVHRYASENLFALIRTKPSGWALLMAAYPVLSVYPQGIIFRAFFFGRYHTVFPGVWLLVLMSATAFSYVHIVFRNWLAVAFSALGGLLFAMRYAQTGSLFVSCFEHALYGCWIFTVGLGRWFFYGAQFDAK